MEAVTKQEKSKSHQEFEKLLSEDLGNRKFKEGEVAIGTISEIGKKFIFVDLGLKSEGAIPVEEFKLTKELDEIKVGSKVEVLLEPFVLTVVAVKLPLALCRYSLTIVELATTDLTVPAAEAPPRLPP